MSIVKTEDWLSANQQYLTHELSLIRGLLEEHASKIQGSKKVPDSESATSDPSIRLPDHAMAIELLVAKFHLTKFERAILLLCAGMELDSRFAQLCARAQDDPRRSFPTFSLALAALPDAHWSAITRSSSLRLWSLIEVASGSTLTTSPISIDERILHYLAGVSFIDHRLQGLLSSCRPPTGLPPSHARICDRIVELYTSMRPELPLIELCGADEDGKTRISARMATQLGSRLYRVRATDIPVGFAERDVFSTIWGRESMLGNALLIDCEDETVDSIRTVRSLLERLPGLVIVSCREPYKIKARQIVHLDVNKPTSQEQREAWQTSLGSLAGPMIDDINLAICQFNFGIQEIENAGAEARTQLLRDVTPSGSSILWNSSRNFARPRIEGLAQRIESKTSWKDLVLPERQMSMLRAISIHTKQRAKVYYDWGFASKSARGLGITALFVGPSGTGKTMAAEVLANELDLDLYRIDLSRVVNRYVGQTEKNLRRLFDAADAGGAVLLFDEADALFGKRSPIKDSHDRYANIEVSYLLQRTETYRGLAILTTNMKEALDHAFTRRIRFVVEFPMPDVTERAEIWKRIFPPETPLEELDFAKLSRYNLSGGNIRNVAMNAAFFAAHSGENVQMKHVVEAVRDEYIRLERPVSQAG